MSAVPSRATLAQALTTTLPTIVLHENLPGKARRLVYSATLAGCDCVVKLQPRTRHSEAEAMMLMSMQTGIPVPELFAELELGDWRILVMQAMAGRQASSCFGELSNRDLHELGELSARTLIALGQFEFPGYGLFDRQGHVVKSFGPWQNALAQKYGATLARLQAGPTVEGALARRLITLGLHALESLSQLSQRPPRLVHGDFSASNLLVARRAGRLKLTAVLDWEWSQSFSAPYDASRFLLEGSESSPLMQSFCRYYSSNTDVSRRETACHIALECAMHLEWAVRNARLPQEVTMRFVEQHPTLERIHNWLGEYGFSK